MKEIITNGAQNTKKFSLHTNVRAGAEVYMCVVKVVDGKVGPVTCEKLGEIK